jgi:hypothetical protein
LYNPDQKARRKRQALEKQIWASVNFSRDPAVTGIFYAEQNQLASQSHHQEDMSHVENLLYTPKRDDNLCDDLEVIDFNLPE